MISRKQLTLALIVHFDKYQDALLGGAEALALDGNPTVRNVARKIKWKIKSQARTVCLRQEESRPWLARFATPRDQALKVEDMKRLSLIIFGIVAFTPALAFAEADAQGCKDHGLFTRMKNYYIQDCEKKFDQALIMLDEDPESAKNLKPEGDKTSIRYLYTESAGVAPSYLQVRRNYQNAATALKATILVDRDRYTAMQIDKSGARIYVGIELFNEGRNISLTILEQKAMEQEITANDMWQALQKDGFMALYINFDTNKATIKPESTGIVGKIIELMKSQPNLKISIEGHTDSQGTPAANKPLSLNRAKAVIEAVSDGGIVPSRMAAIGWGQEKPVADNRTEEGRTKNRRVEIVKK